MKTELETSQEIQDQIWRELSRACKDRHHEWRTPVLSTVNHEGQINARTVVLRAADSATQELTIFTDSRSAKVQECRDNPNALFVFWSKRLNWQLRIKVQVQVIEQGDEVISMWNQIKGSRAAADYTSFIAPGTPILPSLSDTHNDQAEQTYFTILKAQVLQIDWLELSRQGHRRAQFSKDSFTWLNP
jgi:hypothetical protein